MDEFKGEDTNISNEKYSELFDNKYLPRPWIREFAG